MDTYRFETKVLENGTIKIPEFEKYKSQKVEVFLVLKSKQEPITKEKSVDDFLEKWFGFFPEIETEDVRYNSIMDKHR